MRYQLGLTPDGSKYGVVDTATGYVVFTGSLSAARQVQSQKNAGARP
jgi:hypothetical protein